MDEAFGRYRLIGVIGEGGMGTVYRAEDETMGREVAIKVLPAELASEPGYQERFRREAYTAARLTEPHIITIYEAGEINGQLYLTMPVINGIDLQNLLKHGGAMPPRRAVKVIEQIAAALDAAHAAGLVHRDVKPSNALMIANDFVYLIDFGIANDTTATRLTHTGSFVGTFAYMAPERFSAGTGDARGDVYALACVLYECLTGQQPYPGDTLQQQIGAHLTGDIPKPTAVNPAIPAGFDEVIARGMAKDPDQRYQTAQQLATAASGAITAAPAPAHTLTGPIPAPWPDVEHLGQPSGPYSAPQPIAPAAAVGPRFSVTPPPFAPVGPAWAGGPATSGVSRKRWIIAGSVAAAALVITAIVVAVIGLSPGPRPPAAAPRTSTSSPKTSPNAQTTSLTPMPTVAPGRLDSILLSAQEVRDLMGAPGMQAGQIHHLAGAGQTLSDPDCLGTLTPAQQPVYQSSGNTAISGQELREPGDTFRHDVTQAAASFPSADQALAFVTNSAAKWRACAGQTITQTLNTQAPRWTFGDVSGDVPTIMQLHTQEGVSGFSCQHVLSAVSNVVIDVAACGYPVSNEARQIADKMTAKVTQ